MRFKVLILFFLLISACDSGTSQSTSTARSAEAVLPDNGDATGRDDGASSDRPHGAYDPHKSLSPEQQIKVALQHKREGRMPLAIDTLSQALARYGNDKQLLAVRSSLYLETQQLSAALRDMNAALKLDAQDPNLLVNRAEVYRQFGRPNEALADLDRAVSIDQNQVAAYFNRGTLHYQNGEYDKALRDFSRCIDIDAHAAGPYFNRAAVQDRLGDREAAIADMRRFRDLTDSEGWKQKAEELLQIWENPAQQIQQAED